MAATANATASQQDLKQGRLPFKVLDIKTALHCRNTPHLKRKHSTSEDIKSAKIITTESIRVHNKTASIKDSITDESAENLCPENVASEGLPATETCFSGVENKSDLERMKIVKDVLWKSIIEVIDPVPNLVTINEPSVNLNSSQNSSLLGSTICSGTSDLNSSIDMEKSITIISDIDEKTKGGKLRSKEDKEKRKAERERLRQEREKKLAEAKATKRRLSEEARLKRHQEKEEQKQKRLQEKEDIKQKILMKKEQERKEKEERQQEKIKTKEKEKEEKNKQQEEKKLLLSLKFEEKKKKEEAKQKKLEDKKKCEEEEERKKNKVKAAFVSYFIKNETATPVQEQTHGLFKPFEVKKNMMVASVVPANVTFDSFVLDTYLHSQTCSKLYLEELQTKSHKPRRTEVNRRKSKENSEDVIVVDERELMRAKLFSFHENIRPPYWGTWRKKSLTVHPRNPFQKDSLFDYEVDSDEEWDEGGPGESLSGTEDEKESEDDYEVDNEFFVPHGYLSADEEDGEMADSPEMQQVRLKMREKEFEEELKQKCLQLKPCILGCLWSKDSNEELYRHLASYQAINLPPFPIVVNHLQDASDANGNCSPKGSPKNDSQKKRLPRAFPEEGMPHLIKLVHGNIRGKPILVNEFTQFWLLESTKSEANTSHDEPDCNKENTSKESPPSPNISKVLVEQTLKKIATYTKNPFPNAKRCCWWVREEIRTKYDLMDLPPINKWQYITCNEAESSSSQPKTPNQSIMKFARKITPTRVDIGPSSTPPTSKAIKDKSQPEAVNTDPKLPCGKKRTTMSILQFAKRLKTEDDEEASTSNATTEKSGETQSLLTGNVEKTEEPQVPKVNTL